jgi:thiosulfate reductase/polysulfide reductase chain A
MTEKKEGVMQTPISRRTFAKIMGAAGAAAGLGGGAAKMFVDCAQAASVDGVYYGACQICDSQCGYKAVISNGRYELFGNPYDSQSGSWGDGKGRLCVKGYAGPDKALNPDRIYYPMKRTNPKKGPNEDPGFVKITWQEAFDLAATKINETIRTLGPKGIVIGMRGNDWTNRWSAALGTPNMMSHIDTCFGTHSFAWGNLVGQPNGLAAGYGFRPWTQDFPNSTYILSFGYDQVGKAQNPTVQGVIKALENGAKMTVFDPKMTTMAVKALNFGGRYYAIKPGTDLAVMWAMIKWIIANNKWNASFVSSYVNASDFTELQTYVSENRFIDGTDKSSMSVDDVAAWAEGISGVPAADILAVAREFTNDGDYSNHRPIVPTHKRDGAGGPNYANSWRAAVAELILNALVGSIDRKGGPLPDRTFSLKSLDVLYSASKPSVARETSVRADKRNEWKLVAGGQGSFSALFRAIVAEDPYKVGVLMISKYNLPFIAPETDVVVAAMSKVFVINHCFYADEGAWMSDLLLPEMSSYEKKNFVSGGSGNYRPYPAIHINEKMFSSLGDGKGIDAVLYGIARACDDTANAGGYAAACSGYHNDASIPKPADYPTTTFLNGRDSLSKYFTTTGVYGGQQLTGGILSDAQLADLAAGAPANGWNAAYSSVNALHAAEKAQEATGPGKGVYPASGTHTDYSWFGSKKIRLKVVGLTQNMTPWGVTDASGFPGWSPKREDVSPARPFYFTVGREPMHVHTESKAEEIINELSGLGKLEMNEEAARSMGIEDGDVVVIQSRVGTQESVVRLSKHIRPDTVQLMHGWGHWKPGTTGNYDAAGNRTSRGFGLHAPQKFGKPSANDDVLVPSQSYAEFVTVKDPSMTAAMQDTTVSIVKK